MKQYILLIGPEDNYLQYLKDATFKELIDLVPIEDHLRERTHIEEGDVVEMVCKLVNDEEIEGIALVGTFMSETGYLDSLPDDSVQMLEERPELTLSVVDADDDTDDADDVIRIIGIGPNSFVPTLTHDFINKHAMRDMCKVSFVRGSTDLKLLDGKLARVSSGLISELALEDIGEREDILVLYTTDPKNTDGDLPYAVYVDQEATK